MKTEAQATVTAVSASSSYTFTKPNQDSIKILIGLGVAGDAHLGETVKHRSRVRRDPTQPNLRQVHLMHAELHDELNEQGFAVKAGDLGENVTTRGLELLDLPQGTLLQIGSSAIVEVTGLRNPCLQLDNFQQGLTAATLAKDEAGNLIRKAGIMSIVLAEGLIKPGDTIKVTLPEKPHQPLEVV